MSGSGSVASQAWTKLMTIVAVISFLGGFYLAGSLFLASQPWYFRLLAVLAGCVVSLGALSLTPHLKWLRELCHGAKIELRKVFWPTKKELVNTTIMVIIIVAVFSIFLMMVDGLLTLFIRWIL